MEPFWEAIRDFLTDEFVAVLVEVEASQEEFVAALVEVEASQEEFGPNLEDKIDGGIEHCSQKRIAIRTVIKIGRNSLLFVFITILAMAHVNPLKLAETMIHALSP